MDLLKAQEGITALTPNKNAEVFFQKGSHIVYLMLESYP